ncbi:MAG: acylneuraminate cytidylyltransferase family protein [Candidatus Woesearchaeota archaeon]|nr:MAG: acylneuraminate cytidylyltransferase family protein [Candidatus Woesearchaeota archaeon]
MYKEKKILAIIPARGGSKRVVGKNVKRLAGKPLIQYTIDAAKAATFVDRLVVSTDDNDIASVSSSLGVEVISRPEELAQDSSSSMDAYAHAVEFLQEKENFVPDIIIALQPTSPFRDAQDIDGAIKQIIDFAADSNESFSPASPHPSYAFIIDDEENAVPIDPENVEKRTQELPPRYIENGAIFGFTRAQVLLKKQYGKIHKGFIMSAEKAVDIDDELDFAFAELLMAKKRGDN